MNFIEEEIAKTAIRAYLHDYKSKDNDLYELNADRCDKMNDIIAYCQKLERDADCKIIRCMLSPKHEQGYVEVLFNGEFVLGKDGGMLRDFVEAISLCDGVNIAVNPAGDDMLQITFFVENLWVPKAK